MPTDISIAVLCDQRKKQKLFNIPLVRFTPLSPYNGNFTKFQLDMRRKAEVLKYNNSATQTNKLTKAEIFAQLTGKYSQNKGYQDRIITVLDNKNNYIEIRVKYPDKLVILAASETTPGAVKILGNTGYFTYTIITRGLLTDCSKDNLIPTPTSASGVPGPSMYLFYDDTVPLYNFTNESINNASYSESMQPIKEEWVLNSVNNVFLIKNIPKNIGSLLILPQIKNPTTSFSITVPLGIYSKNTSQQTITLNLSMNVQYSGSSVFPLPILLTISNYALDYLPSTTIPGYNYFSPIGADSISISGIKLDTTSGYVYDFILSLTGKFNSEDSIVYANYQDKNLTLL